MILTTEDTEDAEVFEKLAKSMAKPGTYFINRLSTVHSRYNFWIADNTPRIVASASRVLHGL
jgi:hypothetical protein